MKKFLLRYGVFSVTACMCCGIFWLSGTMEISRKAPVSLVQASRGCTAYVPIADMDTLPTAGSAWKVRQLPAADSLTFRVVSVRRESSFVVLQLESPGLDSSQLSGMLGGNTFASGYASLGKRKLREVLLRHVRQ